MAGEREGVSIQQASAMLGVPSPTLRSWERRYGLPVTARSAGGHRRYGEDELRQLALMRDLVAQGSRAAQAAAAVRDLLDESNPGLARVSRLLAAARALDPAAIRLELDAALEELGLGAALDEAVMPAMRRLGSLWATGRCDIAQEHVASEAVRSWLARITTMAPPPVSPRPVVLACGPRDLHTLGMEGLAALLAVRRVGVRVLGARTPAQTLVSAATATDASAVVVVSHLASQRRPAVEALRGAARTGCEVFYAGAAFTSAESRSGVPGTYLGTSLARAADLVEQRLR